MVLSVVVMVPAASIAPAATADRAAPSRSVAVDRVTECRQDTIQEAQRVDGEWRVDNGLLVATAVTDEGLAWQVLDGVELDSVQAESPPVQVGDAVISAAVVLPGAPTGVMPVAEGDHRVIFRGVTDCQPNV